VQLLPKPTDIGQVARLKENVAGVWQAIRRGSCFPNPPPQNRTACPFRSRCPVFAGR
jgi:hypothetical protein